MLGKGPYLGKLPKTTTKVRRVWERPHYGATYSGRKSDDETGGEERRCREYGEQSMTIDVQVSISIGKRQRPETDSSDYDGEYEDRKERGGLRDFG